MSGKTQHDQALNQQFEQEYAHFTHHATTPAGAAAFPSTGTLLAAVVELLGDGVIKEKLRVLWLRLKGGTENPAPPPEPAT